MTTKRTLHLADESNFESLPAGTEVGSRLKIGSSVGTIWKMQATDSVDRLL